MCVACILVSRTNPFFYANSWSLYAKVSVIFSKWPAFYAKFLVWICTHEYRLVCLFVYCGGGGGGCGVFRAWRVFRETSGRGKFECLRLCRCVWNCLGARNLFLQAQPWTRLPIWIPGPQRTWNPISAEHSGVQPRDHDCDPDVNPTFNVQTGFFHFFNHESTHSGEYDLVLYTNNLINW